MTNLDCQDWGLPIQQEYDTTLPTDQPFVFDHFDFSGRKVFGDDIESFVITSGGKTFVVSSELGGNVWQGFVGVYDNWSSAESNLSAPVAYFNDSSTTFSCAVRLNDSAIVCGADKGTVELLRFTSGDNFPDVRIYNTLEGHDDVVSSVSVVLDATHVISGSFDCTTKSWDLDNGQCVSTSNVSNDKMLAVESSPVCTNLYCAASRDGKVRLLDSRLCSGVVPSVLKSSAFPMLSTGVYPTALLWPELSPDTIYAGYSDGALICFDLRKVNEGVSNGSTNFICRPHSGPISSLDVQPDSAVVVSGGEDGNVCIADFSLQCEKRHVVLGRHAGFVRHVKFSNKDSICSAGWDGKLRSFSVSSPAVPHPC